VIRIFPNENSAVRLVGALLLEQSDAWLTGKKYLAMEEYWQTRKDAPTPQSNVVTLY